MLARIAKSVQIGSIAFRQYPRSAVYSQIKQFSDKVDETTAKTSSDDEQAQKNSDKLGSFAKAFIELENINKTKESAPVDNVPFKKMLKDSNFVDVSQKKKFLFAEQHCNYSP